MNERISAEAVARVALLLAKLRNDEVLSMDVYGPSNSIKVFSSHLFSAERRRELAAVLGIERMKFGAKDWDEGWLMESGETVVGGTSISLIFYKAERVK